jgi:riboflavin biosynthesis pyrimidine reductase
MGQAEVAALEIGPDGYDPAALLADLHARGLRHVLVEGGGVTVSRFLAAGLLDRLHVCIAPLIIGSGRAAVSLPEIARLSDARRPPMRTFAMPPDTLFDCDLRG